jgi:hypothetical protein
LATRLEGFFARRLTGLRVFRDLTARFLAFAPRVRVRRRIGLLRLAGVRRFVTRLPRGRARGRCLRAREFLDAFDLMRRLAIREGFRPLVGFFLTVSTPRRVTAIDGLDLRERPWRFAANQGRHQSPLSDGRTLSLSREPAFLLAQPTAPPVLPLLSPVRAATHVDK